MRKISEFTPEVILAETKQLQYLYGLKREIRYAQKRIQEDSTESVAEHIYGMHICALHFLPLEDPEGQLDKTRIYEMISIHDLDEIETGNILGYLKTAEAHAAEANAMRVVMNKAPVHMKETLKKAIDEYERLETKEAQFVKAIDKFEPLIQIFNEKGKAILHTNRTTAENSSSIKEPYIKPFPIMYKFYKTIHAKMEEEGYFHIPE